MLLPREVVDVMEEDLGEEARRRGVEFGKNSNGGRDGNVRFGLDSAQTGTGWSGDGGRQGCWALGVANRGGAASLATGTSTARSARFRSLLRGRRREELDGTGTFEAFARIRAPTPRSGAIADAWRRRRRAQSPVWPASFTVETLSLQ